MPAVREYVLRVVCAALICGAAESLLTDSAIKKHVKLLCGLFLTYAMLSPLVGLELPSLPTLNIYTYEGNIAVSVGQDYAQKAQAEYISEECEAYILDKAEQLQLRLRVEVTVAEKEEVLQPDRVTLEGEYSPEAKEELTEYIEQELGIPKERQQWTDTAS